MSLRSPSVKALRAIFGDNAKQAKSLLLMSRYQLVATPAGMRRFNECHHNPTTQDIRMECLNDLGGFYGVEVLDTKKEECMYLNAGDPYTPTLIRWNGAYRVACWGDIVERHGVAA